MPHPLVFVAGVVLCLLAFWLLLPSRNHLPSPWQSFLGIVLMTLFGTVNIVSAWVEMSFLSRIGLYLGSGLSIAAVVILLESKMIPPIGKR